MLSVYTVDSLEDVVASDGMITLREAIQAANSNQAVCDAEAGSPSETDVIRFAPGLFVDGGTPTERAITLNGGELVIDDALTIEGPGADLLTLDANDQSRVFLVNSDVTVELDALTIANGYIASGTGGGIHNSGTLTITNCALANNSASSHGGGIYNAASGSVFLRESVATGNSTRGSGASGGVAYNNGAFEIRNSTFEDNDARWGGGGIANAAFLTAIESVFVRNYAYYGGGAISCAGGGGMTVVNCSIKGNSTGSYGGGMYTVSAAPMKITGCEFVGNVAGVRGGAICNHAVGTLTLANSTLVNNVGRSGYGGGIYNHDGRVYSQNTIVANNQGHDIYRLNGSITGNANLIGNGSGQSQIVDGQNGNIVGTGSSPADPVFMQTPSAGVDSAWGTTDDNYGDLRLSQSSLAIDGGDNAFLPADQFDLDADGDISESLPLDLAGMWRTLDGDGVEGAAVDIGAYEFADIANEFFIRSVTPNHYLSAAQPSVDLRFSDMLDATVDYSQFLILTDPNGEEVALDTDDAAVVDGMTLRVILPTLSVPGEYALAVDPTLPNATGELLDQDQDTFGGESLDDRFEHEWFFDPNAFCLVLNYPTQGGVNSLTYTDLVFSRQIDPDTLAPEDIIITAPDATTIAVTSITPVEQSGRTAYRVAFPALSQCGTYSIEVGTAIEDSDGDPLAESYTGYLTVRAADLTVEDGLTIVGDAVVGEQVNLSWSIRNTGLEEAAGDLTEAVYLSKDSTWSNNDVRVSVFTDTIDLGPGEASSRSVDVTVPAVEPGTYYLVVCTDLNNGFPELDEGNNRRAVGRIAIDVETLEMDTPRDGVFALDDGTDYFKIVVPAGVDFNLALAAQTGEHSLYVARGRVPNDQDFDVCATGDSGVNVTVPGSFNTDTYYVRTEHVGGIPGIFQLLAEAIDVDVTTWTPEEVGEASDLLLTITGAGFAPGTIVELIDQSGTAIAASSVRVFSGGNLEATFFEGVLQADTYDLRITRPSDGEFDVVEGAIVVTPGGEAIFEANLITPSRVGYHIVSTVYVEYANTGTIAMAAPILVVSAVQNGEQRGFLTLDESIVQQGFWTSAVPEGFSHSVQIVASGGTPGLLQPGESVRVPVYYTGWQQPWDFSYPPINFTLSTLSPTDATPADWSSMKDSLRPDDMPEEAWDSIYAAFTENIGKSENGTWGDYVTMLSENAAYLRRLGETVTDVAELMAFELARAEGMGVLGTLAGGTDAIAAGTGVDIAFSRSFSESVVSRYEMGAFGYGWTTNWELSVSTRDDGTVEVHYPGGSRRIFQPSVRGGYLARPGDNGTLSDRAGGGYMLTELGGSRYAFAADGSLEYVEDTNGNRITCGYDGEGRLTTLSHSSGTADVTIAYNTAGRITSVTDQDGRETVYTYDAAGEHLTLVTGYDGLTTGYTYDTGHALTEIAYADGTHTFYEYDDFGRLGATYADGGAGRVDIARGEGGLVSLTDALGGRTDYYFNQNGAIEKTVDPLGRAVEIDYDSLGNMTRLSDPLGRSTTYAYDDLGNVVRSTNALGYSTRFSYTSRFNQLDLLTDAAGNVTDYDYDTAGNLTSITYADGSLERWEYDATGNVDEWINRRGQSVEYTLDSEGRVTSRTYEDGTSAAFTYDARGNLTESVDPTGTTTYTYDGNDYLTKINYLDGRFLEYTYDTAGRRASMTDELGHATNYTYDSLGRLHQLTDETDAPIITYTYDTLSRLARADKANGTYTVYDYDAAGQLTALFNHAPDDSVSSKFEYTYDAAGLRTSMETLDGTWTYEYDAIGQLTHAVFTPATGSALAAQDLVYGYDAVGNRIRTVINGVETEYTANSLNQYTQVGDTVYEYDDDGNLTRETTAGQVTEYVYDADNRLAMVTRPDGSLYEYTYDAFGNRVAVSENGAVTEYVIDPVGLGNVVGEYAGDGTWQTVYTHGLGLVNQTTAAGSHFYDFDALGSTAAITDALGNVVNSYAYLPFGGELDWTETVANDFQFVGQWGVMNEENGLEFMRARYYDAGVGRFVAADPIGVNGGDTSLYGYCHNQPIATTDASGWLDVDELSTLNTAWGALVKLQSAGAAFAEGDWGAGVYDTIHAGVRLLGRTNPVAKQVGRTWRLYETVSSLCTSVRTRDGLGVLHDSAKLVAMGLAWRGSTPLAKGVGFTALIVDKVTGVWASNVYSIPRYEYDLMTLQAQMRLRELGSQQTTPVRSCDPNDKLGPAGFGDENYIAGEDAVTMPYTIRFENQADATAPAQWIRITDTFDEDLDLNTFELTEFMLGGEIFAIPPGLDSYSARPRRTIEGNDLMIEVEIALDPVTRTLSVSFMALDPETGWMPENPLVGLLYPNDATGRGDGSLAYVVQTAADLPSGTEIVNEATIYFDWNEPIDTPPVVNTIDAEAPTGGVDAFTDPSPGYVNGITVSWSGQDEADGSGIAGYDVYYRAQGEEGFTLWLESTTETEAQFFGIGEEGIERTYEFYAVPIDNVGHRRPVPAGPTTDAAVTFTQALPGDLNLDRLVGSDDLDIVRAHWGETVFPGDLLGGNANGDDIVDSDDLDVVRTNWGRTVATKKAPPPSAAADAVFAAAPVESLFSLEAAKPAQLAWLQALEGLRSNDREPAGPRRRRETLVDFLSIDSIWETTSVRH